jgi:hypothetical protein
MSNTSESGCCGSKGVAKATEHADTTTRDEKDGCGCEGRKAEARSPEPAVSESASATEPTVRSERRGCC